MNLFTAIGLSPGGSGCFTCKQNKRSVTAKFKSGGLHEKRVVATWECWEPSERLLIDAGKIINSEFPQQAGQISGMSHRLLYFRKEEIKWLLL
jgi:hypothetical protein